MDKSIEQLFKAFSHVARDLQIYIMAGCIVLMNLYFIDHVCYSNKWYNGLKPEMNLWILILVSYILGHICLAFYSLIFETPCFDQWLYNKLFSKRYPSVKESIDNALEETKFKLFATNKEMYQHFIERNTNLSLMRWTYSSAFMISGVLWSCHSKWLIGVLILLISVCLLILNIMTDKEKNSELVVIKDVILEGNEIGKNT